MKSQMNGVNKILLASTTLILPFVSGHAQKQNSKEKSPNVIFIMADDLGIGDLGCYGQERIKTPAIDALAEQGMKFTQHYSGSTVSAPSRCVLLTGKHTGHSFIRGNKGYKAEDGRHYDLNLADEEITLGEVFKTKNYTTACVGKWGLGGPSAEGHPNKQGFDYFFGYLGQGNAHNYYPTQLFENNTPVQLGGKVYTHDLIMEKALGFLDKNAEKPFFLYLTPTIPHADIIVPNNELFDYDGKFEEVPYPGKGYRPQEKPRATFAAMVTRLDRDVKRVVDLLAEKGVLDNTIIIFTSDHGEYMGDYGLLQKGPFMYDNLIKVPLLFWGKGVEKSVTSDEIVENIDIVPTILELIGKEVPYGIQGESLKNILQKIDKERVKKSAIVTYDARDRGIMVKSYRDKRYKLNLFMNEEYGEMYDLEVDPQETTNLFFKEEYLQLKNELLLKACYRMMECSDPLSKRTANW